MISTIPVNDNPATFIMKKIFSLILLAGCILNLDAQQKTFPSWNLTDVNNISFEYRATSTTGKQLIIPFDKRFTLVVTKFPNTNVKETYLYLVSFRNGKRALAGKIKSSELSFDDSLLKNCSLLGMTNRQMTRLRKYIVRNADMLEKSALDSLQKYPVPVRSVKQLVKEYSNNYILFKPQATINATTRGDTLLLDMPPIRPAKYFDVLVRSGLNATNLATLLNVNKNIVLKNSEKGRKYFSQLVSDVENDAHPGAQPPMQPLSLGSYSVYEKMFSDNRLDTIYRPMIRMSIVDYKHYPQKDSLHEIASKITRQKIKFYKTYLATRVITDGTLADILIGLLPIDYHTLTTKTDIFDFTGRIKNISATIGIYDSLAVVVSQVILQSKSDSLVETLKLINAVNDTLKSVITILKTNGKQLTDWIDQNINIRQSVMLTGDAVSPDLVTRSNFLITTDLGINNIWARNYKNNVNWIPKLFFGVNIFFRQTDKNSAFKDLPWKWKERPLLSNKNPWQYVSLSLGLTIGGMNNKDFDNLYNTFSLTVGPSIRFSKAFRVTSGVSLLKRTMANPLESNKEITWGPFVAFSIDVDLLTPVRNVSSLLFK